MLNFDIKRKINTLRDILVGKVPDPKAQVEQITIALIYKFMDDMDLQAAEWGNREYFTDEYAKYAWSNIMQSTNSGQERAYLYADGIERMATNPALPQLFRDIFKNAYIPYRDPDTLNMFLKEISDFSYDNSEDLGNAFEYLLSIMGSQGDAGQFRTPRHIIDMMVDIIAPKKNESILDPSCGTAGFLISSYKHILEQNKDSEGKSTLTTDDRRRMTANFAGYDISPDMVRLARVNMYLHQFTKPKISEYDTLTSEEKWDESFDIILANPPFMSPKGGIQPHKRYRVQAKRSEVLFVDYIAEHLNTTGRAAIIVPEGIVFQSATAYKNLRKYLVEDNLLYAVISLPSGVFNPYSGVKTSILLLDKTLAKQKDSILFVKMNNDGFDLGAQRREIKGSNIPEILSIFKAYQKNEDVDSSLITSAKKEDLAKQDYILVGERYKIQEHKATKYPLFKLGDIFKLSSGRGLTAKMRVDGEFAVYGGNGVTGCHNEYFVAESTLVIGRVGENCGSVYLTLPRSWITDNALYVTKLLIGVNLKYLKFILERYPIRTLAKVGGQPSISQDTIYKIEIPLPPLSVQEEIVAEIEGYQKVIDGAKMIVDNYKPTIKIDPSWDMVKLGDVAQLSYGYTDTAADSGNARFMRITDIDSKGRFKCDDCKFINITKQNQAFLLADGDVLVARTGATYGKTAVFMGEYPAIYASFLIKLSFQPKVHHNYYWAFAQSEQYWKQAKELMTGGGQPQFNANAIKQIIFPLPPLDIQKKIVEKINEEMAIVEQNKRLIEIFEQKIKDKISEVWGE